MLRCPQSALRTLLVPRHQGAVIRLMAKAMGLLIPESVLALADEVIE